MSVHKDRPRNSSPLSGSYFTIPNHNQTKYGQELDDAPRACHAFRSWDWGMSCESVS